MNDFQHTLYNDLLKLTQTNEAFFYKDQELDDQTYRVFSYRLASYTDFLAPNSLECRGVMFRIIDEKPVELSALPMEKFFNDQENPFTIGLNYNNIKQVTLKMDGSLMSTYIHNGQLRIKSKTALGSDHAINAMRWLDLPENAEYKKQLLTLTRYGWTVNMEYTSPEPYMRIVIGYQEPKLTILNIRSKADGNYLNKQGILPEYNEIINHWVELKEVEDGPAFIESIPEMTGIEGYVIQLSNGQHVKKKTIWYSALHKTKDSVTNPRRLFECVLEETTDDLRNLFHDDPYSLKLIEDMEVFVAKIYNHLVKTVDEYYEHNKDLDRKDYAIKGQTELDKKEFSLAMLKYTGKPFSYKEIMKKWYKDFGLADQSILEEE